MADTRVITSKLQYVAVVDPSVQAASQQVQQTLQATQSAASSTALQYASVAEAAAALGLDAGQIAQLEAETVAAGDAAKQASQQYQDMAKSAQDAADSGSDSGGGGGFNVTGSRRGLTALGSLAGGSPGLSDAARLVSVTAAFGPFGLALGGAATLLKAATDAEAARSAEVQKYIDAVKQSVGTTTADIQKNIANLKSQNAALNEAGGKLIYFQERIAQLNSFKDTLSAEDYSKELKSINEQVYDLTGGTLGLKNGVGDAVIDTDNFNSALGKNHDAIKANNDQIGVNTSLLGTQAVAAADAAAAADKLAKTQLSAVGLIQKADQMTDEQRKTREAAIQREIQLNTEALNSGDLNYAAGLQVLQSNRDLRKEYDSLVGVQSTYADKLKAEADEKDRINTATTNYFDALTKQGEAAQATAKAQQDLAGSTQEHQDQLLQISQDEQQKEITDRQKAAQTVEQDTQKHLDKVQEIEDQYNQDHEAAVGNRDALANYKAKQQEDKSLSKEQATFTAQEAQQQVHLTEQLKADQSAQAKAVAGENSSYTKRYNQLLASLQSAQVAESRAAGLSAAYQAQANQNRLVMEVNHQNAVLGQVQVGLNLVEVAYRQHFANLSGIAQAAAPTPFQNSIVIGNAFNNQINQAVNQQITRVVRGATQYR